MTANRPHYWPEASGYEDPRVQYDPHSRTFVAEFTHESHLLLRHIFTRREGGESYHPLTSLDRARIQEQMCLDSDAPRLAYLECELEGDERTDRQTIVAYDLDAGDIACRWSRDDIRVPEVYEGVGYISELLQLCRRGGTLRCTVALFGAPAVDPETSEASYDMWVCTLDLQSGELERLAEMEHAFC